MLKRVSDLACHAIQEKMDAGFLLKKQINEKSIWDVFDYFEQLEISLSSDETEGKEIDFEEMKKACAVVDELNVDEKDEIDLLDLNRRLHF